MTRTDPTVPLESCLVCCRPGLEKCLACRDTKVASLSFTALSLRVTGGGTARTGTVPEVFIRVIVVCLCSSVTCSRYGLADWPHKESAEPQGDHQHRCTLSGSSSSPHQCMVAADLDPGLVNLGSSRRRGRLRSSPSAVTRASSWSLC